MLFTRKPLFIACAIASSVLFTACSNNTEEKKQDSLTASAPATGEASTLTERNAKQRLIDTLQKHFKTANINAKIIDIKTTVPRPRIARRTGFTSHSNLLIYIEPSLDHS